MDENFSKKQNTLTLRLTLSAVGVVQISSLIIGTLNSIILSRWLEPSGRGIFIFLSLIAQFVGALLDFGIPNTISTFLLRREYPFQSIFNIGLVLSFIRSMLSVIIITGLWLFWPKFHDVGWVALVLVLVACSLNIFYILGRTVLFTAGDLKWWASFEVSNIVIITTAVLLSWVTSFSQDPIYAYSLYVVVQIIILIGSFIIVRGHVEYKISRPSRNLLRKVLKFTLKNVLNNLVWILGARTDIYVVGTLLSSSSLGIYSLSTGLADKIQSLLMTLPQSLYPSQATGQSNNQAVEKITAKAIRISLALGLIVAFCLAFVSPFIIPFIFGEEYNDAVSPFIILAFNSVIFMTFHFFGGYMTGQRMKPEVSAFFGIIMAIVNLVCNLVLIPKLDLFGAALANLISTIAVLIPFGLYFSKITSLSIKEIFIIELDDIANSWDAFNKVFVHNIPRILKFK